MEPPSLETVYQAISTLYDNPNPSEKEKASVWLGDMQKSIHSWRIADELLQHKKDIQSCYFAAQTMRSKVQHNLSELPKEYLDSLRDSLINNIAITAPDTGSIILTQLSLALADLALQMPTWQSCVSDLINKFSNTNHDALLEILTVLPQEVDSTSLKLGENRRETIKAELRQNSQIVSMFLKESVMNEQNSTVKLKIMKCMTSWIQVRAFSLQDIPQNAVIGYCVQILSDINSVNIMHDAACDCICALLHYLEENTCEEVDKLVFESVSSLENNYHMSIAHEEEEKVANYAKLFTELSESFLDKIITSAACGNTHFAMRSLELALICVGHHDYEVAAITFQLWHRLSEEVYQRDYEPLTNMFRPHIQRLVAALARHAQCEPDHTKLPEEGDDFYEFRLKVMDLIRDVVFIVGSSSVFQQMFSVLQTDISWEQSEAALFIMQTVAKNIVPDEYDVVPKVVEAILSMPWSGHLGVRATCTLLVGELCEWVDAHPACVQPALHHLLRALHDPPLAPHAALALQRLCKACRGQMGAHIDGLLQVVENLDSLALTPETATGLLRGIAAIIGNLKSEQMSTALRTAVGVQVRALRAAVTNPSPFSRGSASDPVKAVDRLAALFRGLESKQRNPHPALPALTDAWPVLHEVITKYSSEGRVMERTCRALRFSIRCVSRAAAPLLPPLAADIADAYHAHAHSCFLYLASILVDELCSDPECVAALMQLFQQVVPRALSLLTAAPGIKEHPDTVDDLFRLCIRLTQRAPAPLLRSGAMGAVVECACVAAALDHRDANASVMKFLFDLVHLASNDRRRDDDLTAMGSELMSVYGNQLTNALVQAAALHLHSYMLSEVGEVLHALVSWGRGRNTSGDGGGDGEHWLLNAVSNLPRDSPATPTHHQLMQFHQYAVRAETCKEMTRLLRDFARLYR